MNVKSANKISRELGEYLWKEEMNSLEDIPKSERTNYKWIIL